MSKTSKLTSEAWSIPQLQEPRYSQSLERGLAILCCYTPERPVLGIVDIADELGMSRSTTHRYVITLTALGYLEQVSSRKYRLGLKVTDLGMSVMNATGLKEHARPYLEELSRLVPYTVSLAVLNWSEVVLVDRLLAQRRRSDGSGGNLHPGSRLPAYCTAAGKVLLADLPEVGELLKDLQLTQRGPNTIISKKKLRVELSRVRKDGLAINDEELVAGRHAIAVPIRNSTLEVVAALGIATDVSAISLQGLIEAFSPYLQATAARISARLGYRRGDERQP